MASEQTFFTTHQDLRSDAKEFTRDENHRAKWVHGHVFGPGRREEDARPRPARVVPTPKIGNRDLDKARAALKNHINYASGESSADEDIEEPSAAPCPDADITYSFDAQRGPSHGSQILGQALHKAIERFEVRETDKLIKQEYEVLDGGALSPASKIGKKNPTGEDDDYEFL